MPTTLEVVHWPASEAYVKDNTILKPAGDVIARSPGLQKIWYGQQVEETRAYMAIAWDSLAAHMALVADEGNISKVGRVIGSTLVEGATREMLHGQFDIEGAPSAVLNAPVTEFGVVTPKAGHEDVVKSVLTKLTVLLNEPESPAVGGAFAPIIEKDGSYLLLIGWNSVEDKWAKSLQIMEELLGNAEITLSHVKLLQHESV